MGFNYKAITGSSKITRRPAFVVGGLGGFLGSSGYRGTDRSVQIRANGQGQYRFAIFRPNQLSRIGSGGARNSTMFAPNADGVHTVAATERYTKFPIQSGLQRENNMWSLQPFPPGWQILRNNTTHKYYLFPHPAYLSEWFGTHMNASEFLFGNGYLHQWFETTQCPKPLTSILSSSLPDSYITWPIPQVFSGCSAQHLPGLPTLQYLARHSITRQPSCKTTCTLGDGMDMGLVITRPVD